MVNITLKTLKQEIYHLDIDLNITISDLKQQLTQFGYNVSEMKLIFKGRVLEDNNTLATYNYNPESKDFIVIMTIKKPIEPPKISIQPVSIQIINQNDQSNNDQSNNDQSITNQSNNENNENNDQSITNQSNNENNVSLVDNENEDDYEDVEDELPNIAQLLNQNPNILLGLIAQHPQMSQLFNHYPNEIQELISNPNFMQTVLSMGSQGAFGNNPNVLQINITEEERNDINELMSLGFTENEVIQVYYACNKNKEQAAIMLFEDNNL
jgi:hypothetical protein